MKEISFIHAADLHLDSPFLGLSHVPDIILNDIQDSTFNALERLIKVAIQKEVDFILLVGDLFDNEKQSLRAQIRLREAFKQLEAHHIQVYLSYGNHDCVSGNIHPVTFPDNVHIFQEETVSSFTYRRNDQALATIYGFSYEGRAVLDNKAKEFKVIDSHTPFHIATLHGSIKSNTDHDVYAPFYLSDLANNDFDYWALGHIHQKNILKEEPLIVYPGNSQGRHRKEEGERGCYYVTLSEEDSNLSFIPLQAIQFKSVAIQATNCLDIYDLEEKINSSIQSLSNIDVPILINVTLNSNESNIFTWEANKLLEELIETINEGYVYRDPWRYIYHYNLKTEQQIDKTQSLAGEHFYSEITKQTEEVNVKSIVGELYNHRQVRKYITTLTHEEERAIRQRAEQILYYALLDVGGD